MNNLILKNARILSPVDDLDDIYDIKIENGTIKEIAPKINEDGIDFAGMIITPGFVDMHCHLREPGFEYKETIKTGIESALKGGFTAICPMANTKPVIDNEDELKNALNKALGINLYQICAITKGLAGKEAVNFKKLKSLGAIAFSDDGKPLEDIKIYQKALLSGNLIISHAEDPTLQGEPLSEAVAIAKELEILRETGGKLHFAHISTKRSIELIRQAKKEGLHVTCETAPHYFSFTKDDETDNGKFKMNPPLRSKSDLNAVIEGLKDGTIDCIATDHAPHSLEEKKMPFAEAPYGIVGFETAFSASFKNLVIKEHLTFAQLVEKMSTNPAKILGLVDHGSIKTGQKANLTIINPYKEFIVNPKEFKSKCKISPFEGQKLQGKITAVIINGELKKQEQKLCKQ